jgi:hypothetical protein
MSIVLMLFMLHRVSLFCGGDLKMVPDVVVV